VQASGDIAATVTQLVTLLQQQQQTAAIDLDTVRRVMRDELPSLIPVTRIEVVNNGSVISLDPAPHHKNFAKLVKLMASANVMHAYLVGPAGSGKTTGAENAAKAVGRKVYIQGATSGSHELLGYSDGSGTYHTTPFRQAFEQGGIVILDEIDGGANDSLLVINAGTANGYMSFPDSAEPVQMHPDFRVIACANTWGKGADRMYVGRSQLDASTIDRFFMIEWNYDEKLERALCGNEAWCDRVQALRSGADKEKARIVISPRAAIKGAQLLAEGWLQSDVEEGLIWRGADKELRRRIEAAA
jgi:cobaltochelatase CobS